MAIDIPSHLMQAAMIDGVAASIYEICGNLQDLMANDEDENNKIQHFQSAFADSGSSFEEFAKELRKVHDECEKEMQIAQIALKLL